MAWNAANIATGFTELRPNAGRAEAVGQNTEVRILYDNTAIYIAAYMHDTNPDSIAREIAQRDRVGNADFFGVAFDTYLDKINGNGFYVTAAGSQFDAKYSQTGGEDGNWNAVWYSSVKINKDGWSTEIKIPYSALRFSNKDVQTWGINFTRKRFKTQQQFFWNALDPTINGYINQEGELNSLENITSPIRLSFSPYISSYVNNYPYNLPGIKNTTGTFNGGMDIKYGINQSFTLDMTLVPDFGQVKSDRQVLNLSPFEVRYDENRSFFTEGTEWLVENQPLTNYNILVFDQSLKNNSSVSVINTNVLRQGTAYDANVSAVQFNLNDKKNIWNVSGTGRMSYLNGNLYTNGSTGHSYDLSFGKQSGKFKYSFQQNLADAAYNNNDLGILNTRNYFDNSVFGEMNLFKGKKVYNQLNAYMQLRYSQRLKPNTYQSFSVDNGMYIQFKNLWSFNLNTGWEPEANDFYESRNGSVYKALSSYNVGGNINSSRVKRYSAGIYAFQRASKRFNSKAYDIGFNQNLRISNKLKIGSNMGFHPSYNASAFAGVSGGKTIFSRYDRQTIENSIDAQYTFNTNMGITLGARHYWSSRKNKDFYNLGSDGYLTPSLTSLTNTDRNLNTFNVDMVYRWQFSPGSEFSVAYKDASFISSNQVNSGYTKNLDLILNSPQSNTLSFKLLYYLDYLQLKKKQPVKVH